MGAEMEMKRNHRWRALAITACFCLAIIALTRMRPPGTVEGPGYEALSAQGLDGQGGAAPSLRLRVRDLEQEVAGMAKELKILKLKSWQEHLDPTFQFRPKYILGKAQNPEDKSVVEPWFLGHMVNTTQIKRRVYVDLGMMSFETSICFMLQAYPAKFNEVHAFECCPQGEGHEDEKDLPPLDRAQVQDCLNHSHGLNKIRYSVDEVFGMVKMYKRFVGVDDKPASEATKGVPQVGLVKFLRSLDLTPDDFVVVKMDIEASEYETLAALMEDEWARGVVDELMVEMHYKDQGMGWAGWDIFKDHSLSEAHVLLQKLRDTGIVVHPWP